MSTISPISPNFLLPTKAEFVLSRAPQLSYSVQQFALPGFSLPRAEAFPTPFTNLGIPGDKMQFMPLTVSYKIDENMGNYLEVFNWAKALGFPQSFDQYKSLADNAVDPGNREQLLSDATLVIHTSASRPNIKVTFIGLFPVGVPDVAFDVTQVDQEPVVGSATFEYTYYTIEVL